MRYLQIIQFETQTGLTAGPLWILEIENDTAADRHALLPDAAEVCAEKVDLRSPRDMWTPLDVHTAATQDTEGVERCRTDALIKAIMRAAGEDVSPGLILALVLTNSYAASVEYELLADERRSFAKRSRDVAFKSEHAVTEPAGDAGVNSV